MKKLTLHDEAVKSFHLTPTDCKLKKHPFVIEKQGFQTTRFLCKEHISPLLHQGFTMRMLDAAV